jgi:hypothetical protein
MSSLWQNEPSYSMSIAESWAPCSHCKIVHLKHGKTETAASKLHQYTLTGFTSSEHEYRNTGFPGGNTIYPRQDMAVWRSPVAIAEVQLLLPSQALRFRSAARF